MRCDHVAYLSDPNTHQKFKLMILTQEGDHVVDGILTTALSWYPIIGGIPRILTAALKQDTLQVHHDWFNQWRRKLPKAIVAEWQTAIKAIPDVDAFLAHQKKTAESFAYEWKYIYRENDYEKHNFFHFLSPYVSEKDLKGRVILDIGCGSGRFTKWAALSGTKVSFGGDLGETVEVAYKMTKDLPNVCIIQADIYAMPFESIFDIAYSIGVLHHLPRPQEGFSRLPKTVKKGGKMLIWVYNRRHNARALYFYEPLRALLKRLPKPFLFRLCYMPALGVQAINEVTVGFEKLGLTRIAKKMPFYHYTFFPFNMKLNDAFDVLATPKSNYYLKEEIEGWFMHAHLNRIRAYEHPEAGITCVGTVHG